MEQFLQACSEDIRSDFYDAIAQLVAGKTLQTPLSKNLSNIHRGLHELRLKDRNGQVRFIYFIKKGDAIYLIHGFRKKTQKLPQKEQDVVLKRLKEVK